MAKKTAKKTKGKTAKKAPKPRLVKTAKRKRSAAEIDAKIPKTPTRQALPGMEDRAIEEIEAIASRYADCRDARMELNEREVELKSDLLALMHKHGKTEYRRDGIEVRVVTADETVKVRIKRGGDEADDAAAEG